MAYQRPAKLLKVTISGISTAATYSGADPWNGAAIRWNATLAVTAQPHSDTASTPASGFYDGRNINVGDYVASMGGGRVLRIYSISAQSAGSVTCVLEDFNRTNTFLSPDQDGNGLITTGIGYVFEVVNGYPILHPLPDALQGAVPFTFATQIIARFLSIASVSSAPYTQTFNATTDWGSAVGGYYTISITSGTHGKGTNIVGVEIYEDDGTNYVFLNSDVLRWNKTTGTVSILVTDTPDGRFAGRIVIR